MEKNKTGKYFKYAIGEIVLVVIGILIALSINNWNEGLKNQKVEKSFYKDILNDLDKDSIKLAGLTTFYKNRIEHAGWLLEKLRNPESPVDPFEIGQHIHPLYIGPLSVNYNSSYEAAKSSGAFGNFNNKEIIKTLSQFYADIEELKGILQATLRWLETGLEPLMSTIPGNYTNANTGVYVLTSELLNINEFYDFSAKIEDKRDLPIKINTILKKPQFEYYLTGDLGRSFNALGSLKVRKQKLSKLKNDIKNYIKE